MADNDDIPFNRDFPLQPGVVDEARPGVRRVLCNNPSPFTFTGTVSYIVGKGLPMGTQMLLIASSQLVVIGLVNREGLNATAAYGASMQLWNYLQMPAFALGTAISAMVAQNIGAGHHERVGEITRVGMLANLAMTGLLAAIVVAASHPLLALFLGGASPAMPIAA